MTIAEQIYKGATAKELGIGETSFLSRQKMLDRFLADIPDFTDFHKAYIGWLSEQPEAQHGNGKIVSSEDQKAWKKEDPSRGFGDTIAKATSKVGIKPCGGCGKRQTILNKAFPYRSRKRA